MYTCVYICTHGPIVDRQCWLTLHSEPYNALAAIVKQKSILKVGCIAQLRAEVHINNFQAVRGMTYNMNTSCVESLNSVQGRFTDQKIAWQDGLYTSMMYVSVIHWNNNIGRELKKTKGGEQVHNSVSCLA